MFQLSGLCSWKSGSSLCNPLHAGGPDLDWGRLRFSAMDKGPAKWGCHLSSSAAVKSNLARNIPIGGSGNSCSPFIPYLILAYTHINMNSLSSSLSLSLSPFLSLSLSLSVYIYRYIYIYGERDRDRDRTHTVLVRTGYQIPDY